VIGEGALFGSRDRFLEPRRKLPDDVRARISECADLDLLDRWLASAVTAMDHHRRRRDVAAMLGGADPGRGDAVF
jgi:hypothetical protein